MVLFKFGRLPLNWSILPLANLSNLSVDLSFPWDQPPVPVYILKTGGDDFLLSPLPAGDSLESDRLPVCELSPEDFKEPGTWTRVFGPVPPSRFQIASYYKKIQNYMNDPAPLLSGMGIHPSRGNLEDFQERLALSPSGLELGIRLDLPLPVLRLWEGLDEGERSFFNDLDRIHPIKKNLFREMIQDFYELDGERRRFARDRITELAERLDTGHTRFPTERLRDELRLIRYPLIEPVKRELLELQKKIKQETGLDLLIPPDLESDELEVRFKIGSESQLIQLSRALQDEDSLARFRRALELLRS